MQLIISCQDSVTTYDTLAGWNDSGDFIDKNKTLIVKVADRDYNYKGTNTSSSSVETSSTLPPSKPSGYKFNVIGTCNEEGKHIITAEETGKYDIECYDVDVPARFYSELYSDYQNLSCFVTIFPDNKNYDSIMDGDKAVYDKQLTSPLYISELYAHKVKPINGNEFTYTGGELELKEGYQIMVLGGSVKFTKQ